MRQRTPALTALIFALLVVAATSAQTVLTSSGATLSVTSAKATKSVWTALAPAADSRIIFADSVAGDDATARPYTPQEVGADPTRPLGSPRHYRTLTAAAGQVRSGYPDWIVMKGDSVFNDRIWPRTTGGRAGAPLVITSEIAGRRPVVRNPDPVGVWETVFLLNVSHVALVDFEIDCPVWANNPVAGSTPRGIAGGRGTDWLIEGVKVTQEYNNVDLSGIAGLRVYRCVFADSTSDPSLSGDHGRQNIILGECSGIDINACVLDRPAYLCLASVYPHNLYLAGTNADCVLRNTISSRGWNTTQLRIQQSQVLGCVFLDNADSVFASQIHDSVVLGSRDTADDFGVLQARGVAYGLVGPGTNFSATDNIASGEGETVLSTGAIAPLVVDGHDGLNGCDIHGNVFWKWRNPAVGYPYQSDGVSFWNTVTNLRCYNNAVQNGGPGRVYSLVNAQLAGAVFYGSSYASDDASGWDGLTFPAWSAAKADTSAVRAIGSYPAPTRTLAAFLLTKGVPTAGLSKDAVTAAYMARAREQQKRSYDPAWTAPVLRDFVRGGFGMPALGETAAP